MSIQPNPLLYRACASIKSITSSCSASGAPGSAERSVSTFPALRKAAARKLADHKGMNQTWPASSSSESGSFRARKWSIQTEVSTNTTA